MSTSKFDRKHNIIVALENLRSLYNVGAIFRTCEFFGVYKVILIGYSGVDRNEPDLIHKRLWKTSCGTMEKVEIEHFDTLKAALEKYKPGEVIAIENNVQNPIKLKDWRPNPNTMILFGNEVDGLSREAISMSDKIVEIPRVGTHSSLNVTTACGIVLNHVVQF